jgi:hypothetical protein
MQAKVAREQMRTVTLSPTDGGGVRAAVCTRLKNASTRAKLAQLC